MVTVTYFRKASHTTSFLVGTRKTVNGQVEQRGVNRVRRSLHHRCTCDSAQSRAFGKVGSNTLDKPLMYAYIRLVPEPPPLSPSSSSPVQMEIGFRFSDDSNK